MEYRNLGRTGVKVSPLCLGCMVFGGRTEPEDAYPIIDRAIDQGINFLDTANVYHRGRSEEVVGEALARNGHRDRTVLATKVHGKMADDDPNARGNHRYHIVAQCEASLRRLKTDRIDLYQIHRPLSDIPIDETLRALDDLIRAGKVLYIGSSTFAAWQVVESLWVSKELGLNRFVSEQPPYNLMDRRIERELVPMAQTFGIALIPWSPLASGFLTGKYKRDAPPPEEARIREGFGRYEQLMTKDQTFDVVEAVEKMAQEKGCTPSQLSLAWCMHQPGITSPIIGPRTMAQLEDNLGALNVEITDSDREKIDQFAPPGQMTSKFYEANFGPHPHRVL
jgi:aryl-alcohol dehydrogenase-like predicted oxidoreductase